MSMRYTVQSSRGNAVNAHNCVFPLRHEAGNAYARCVPARPPQHLQTEHTGLIHLAQAAHCSLMLHGQQMALTHPSPADQLTHRAARHEDARVRDQIH